MVSIKSAEHKSEKHVSVAAFEVLSHFSTFFSFYSTKLQQIIYFVKSSSTDMALFSRGGSRAPTETKIDFVCDNS